MFEKPKEEKSVLQYGLIDYLHGVGSREVDKATRIAITNTCRDADYIPKVKDAGRVVADKEAGTYQVMHNGLKVAVDGYYGAWVTDSIRDLNGHHEPQEEKVFYEVSKRLAPHSWMIELGSYWSYYSLWFHQAVKDAHNICCEPDPENLKIGKRNAELNNFDNMFFVDAATGSVDGELISFEAEHVDEPVTVPIRTVDSLVKEYKIKDLQVLHMDVQGFELDALHGAKQSIQDGIVRFVFISTHHYLISRNPNIHQDCLDFIASLGGHVVCEHDIHESYSGDGLIVASFSDKDKDFTVEVSRNRMSNNQFRAYTKDLQLSFAAYDHILGRLVDKNTNVQRFESELEALRTQNKQLVKDIEHFNNLPIPHATRELLKSVKRSAKFRVTRAIWGKDRYYQSDEQLTGFTAKIDKLEVAKKALAIIKKNDSDNVGHLAADPNPRKVMVFEALRKVSHIPRRIKRSMGGK